jgi:hypothetical protein
MPRRRKLGGRFTEPDLPPGRLVVEKGVTIEHLYRSGDHGPPHFHVTGQGVEVCIGQNGKRLDREPPLTGDQNGVIRANLRLIRKAARRIGRWYWFDNLG